MTESPVSGVSSPVLPDTRGDPALKYIRSGPEGARGVLEGRVCLSLYVPLCMCLSSCAFLYLLPDLRGLPGLRADTVTEPLFFTLFSHRFFEGFFEGFGIDFG